MDSNSEFETETRDQLLTMTARQHMLAAANIQAGQSPNRNLADIALTENRTQTHLLFALVKYMDEFKRRSDLTHLPEKK